MKQPILSVCIPTFNRGHFAFESVSKLLESELDQDSLCVYVRDDCSTDRTAEVLSGIEDPRFRYVRNEKNLGAAYNTHLCFLESPGKYSYLTSDEDDIIPAKLSQLVEILSSEDDVSVLLLGGDLSYSAKRFPEQRITDPFEALMKYGFSTRYMTGIVFNNIMYREHIGQIDYDEAPDIWDSYSFMYAMAKLFCCGVTITKVGSWYKQNRLTSTVATNNAKRDGICYYEPQGRLNQMHTWLRAIQLLELPLEQKELVSVKVIFDCANLLNAIFEPNYANLVKLTASPGQYEDYCRKLSGASKGMLCSKALAQGQDAFCSLFGYSPQDSSRLPTVEFWDARMSELEDAMSSTGAFFAPAIVNN